MRGLKRNPWLSGLGVLLAILVVSGGHARADVSTDQSGSIVIFPKIIADGSRDTLIQITNTSNMSAEAHCFYVNASGRCSVSTDVSCKVDTDCPGTEQCIRQCTETNFDLFLTAQQPTVWRASTGRLVDVTVPACRINEPCACTQDPAPPIGSGGQHCPGFDPGTGSQNSFAVKPTGTDFEGELKCVETFNDQPVMQNSLKGEAVIEDRHTGQISEYNALAIAGLPALNTDNDLNLDGSEYNACPADLVLNHYADGAQALFSNATVSTELTLVPCTEILEQQLPTHARALFSVTNEFEQPLSASVTFDCFLNERLADISNQLTVGNIGTPFAKTRIAPPSGNICYSGDNRCHSCEQNDTDPNCIGQPVGQQVGACNCSSDLDCGANVASSPDGSSLGCRPWSGLLGVAEEFHSLPGLPDGTAAANLHQEGARTSVGGLSPDLIVIPAPVPVVP